jgi:hypothetical protein
MTRINSGIPVSQLCDQHLVAEYREIGRVGTQLEKRAEKGISLLKNMPSEFTLGTGHVTFFMDKGLYIHLRFDALKREMLHRGFQANLKFRNAWAKNMDLYRNWVPDLRTKTLLVQRISEMMPEKPRWTNREPSRLFNLE